ncbi:MAG: aldolase [Armatimonadota bacterium]|nr:MAG: aldolase [Armatimonadota bacterium]
MKTNRTRDLLSKGKTALGTMIGECASPEVVRTLARAGFDFVIVDNEHAPFSLEDDSRMYRAARTTAMDLLVRVPDAQYHLIARTLDAGADGIMAPRIETPEQARLVVDSVKYPPVGRRGAAHRAIHTDNEPVPLGDYTQHLNANTMVIAQLETRAAIDRADEILAVEGIDVALIGPADLSVSLGVPGEIEHPLMEEYIGTVVAAAERAGVASGIHWGDAAVVRKWMERGMRCIMYSSEMNFLAAGARAAVAEMRS